MRRGRQGCARTNEAFVVHTAVLLSQYLLPGGSSRARARVLAITVVHVHVRRRHPCQLRMREGVQWQNAHLCIGSPDTTQAGRHGQGGVDTRWTRSRTWAALDGALASSNGCGFTQLAAGTLGPPPLPEPSTTTRGTSCSQEVNMHVRDKGCVRSAQGSRARTCMHAVTGVGRARQVPVHHNPDAAITQVSQREPCREIHHKHGTHTRSPCCGIVDAAQHRRPS